MSTLHGAYVDIVVAPSRSVWFVLVLQCTLQPNRNGMERKLQLLLLRVALN